MGLVDESEDEAEDDEEEMEIVRRRPARKLTEDFDRVAAEGGLRKKRVSSSSSSSPAKSSGNGSEGVGLRTRSRRSDVAETKNGKSGIRRREKCGSTPTSAIRTFPRLIKKGAK